MDADKSIYGNHLEQMNQVMDRLKESMDRVRQEVGKRTGMDPVEHLLCRIKSEESMREKCRRNGLPETEESALVDIHDAIGFRIVCAFLDDVYAMRDGIAGLPGLEVVREKDYIRHAKPNGYRSYHMIIKLEGYFAEIQLRTISMDTWAALEHHIRYKKRTGGNQALIHEELKRCADELASTDVSMQIIRNMIQEEKD